MSSAIGARIRLDGRGEKERIASLEEVAQMMMAELGPAPPWILALPNGNVDGCDAGATLTRDSEGEYMHNVLKEEKKTWQEDQRKQLGMARQEIKRGR